MSQESTPSAPAAWQFEELERVSPDAWEAMRRSADGSIFFLQSWDSYLEAVGRRRFVVAVRRGSRVAGYFVGSRYWLGIKVVMAPSMGTGTYTQGLCMLETVSEQERIDVYRQLARWLFKSGKAAYLQIRDLQVREESTEWKEGWRHRLLDEQGLHYTPRYTFLLDVSKPVEELWAGLHYKSCKYSINKARKLGLTARVVEREEDIEPFVDRHFSHNQDMLQRKKTKGLPSQRRDNMSALCHALFPDHVLMLEVVGPDGQGREVSMSSCIFAYGPGGSTFFTSASYQQYMRYCPNDLMVWEALSQLHERRAGVINMGGTADYKKKYGPVYALIPIITFSKYGFLHGAYRQFKSSYARLLSLLGRLR